MPLRINEDGSLPTWRDPTDGGRPKLASDVEAALSTTGGAHPDLAAHTTLGLAATAHAHAHNHDAAYSATGHTHAGGDHPDLATHDALGLATDAALAAHNHDAAYAPTHAHPYSADNHTHAGGSEAFPVGSVFLSVVSTNPATLLGYGTWSQIAGGRFLVGQGNAPYDTPEATGGATTHTHTAHTGVISHTHTTDSQGAHVHDEYRNSATTGSLDGWAAGDTSTNTATLTGYDTGSAGAHTHTAAAPAGAVNEYAHDSPSHLPPYFVAYIWKRTA